MNKHTPGPWVTNGSLLAAISEAAAIGSEPAPDLREALRNLANDVRDSGLNIDPNSMLGMSLRAAFAALSKAGL